MIGAVVVVVSVAAGTIVEQRRETKATSGDAIQQNYRPEREPAVVEIADHRWTVGH